MNLNEWKELAGQEVEIDCCDSCNTWTVGEDRCSCGNRRIYLADLNDDGLLYPQSN